MRPRLELVEVLICAVRSASTGMAPVSLVRSELRRSQGDPISLRSPSGTSIGDAQDDAVRQRPKFVPRNRNPGFAQTLLEALPFMLFARISGKDRAWSSMAGAPGSPMVGGDGVSSACSLTGSLWSRPGEDQYAAVVEPARCSWTPPRRGSPAGRLLAGRDRGAHRARQSPPGRQDRRRADGGRLRLGARHPALQPRAGPGQQPGLLADGEPVRCRATVPAGRARLGRDVAAAIAAADDAVEVAAT